MDGGESSEERASFRATRRAGAHGWIGFFRAVVTDGRGRTVLVRSLSDGALVAGVLNGGPAEVGSSAGAASRVVRYSAVPARKGGTMIVSDERGRDRGRVPSGNLGLTMDRGLAEYVVQRLNELDPARFKPRRDGVGLGMF